MMATLARLLALTVCALALEAGSLAAAEARNDYWIQRPASTGRDVQQEATSSLPLNKLRPEVAAQVREIAREPSLFRRLPQQTIDCDADLFLFSLRNPEVIVNIWELMGVTGVTLERTGEYSFTGSDGEGTTSNIQLLYGTRDTQLFLCDGQYDGPLWRKKLTGHGVLLMRSKYATGKDGRSYVTNTLDVFMKIDNAGADLLARTLHPLFGSTVDTNFLETCGFVSRLSKSAERNGPGVANLAERLTKVDPPVRAKFAEIGLAIGRKAGGEPSASTADAKPAATSTIPSATASSTTAAPATTVPPPENSVLKTTATTPKSPAKPRGLTLRR